MKKLLSYSLIFLLFFTTDFIFAKENCQKKFQNKVKVEAWLSKKYEKQFRNIQKEFLEMGNTKVGLLYILQKTLPGL